MSEQARVHDTKALRDFRPALIRFGEDANAAMVSVGADAGRVLESLRLERLPHWKREIRVRSEQAVRANTKLIQQTAGDDPRPSVDARKEYERAKRAVQEAEDRYAATQRWIRELQREIDQYRTAVQPMATIVRARTPAAIAALDNHIASLDAYTAAERTSEDKRPPTTPTTDADPTLEGPTP